MFSFQLQIFIKIRVRASMTKCLPPTKTLPVFQSLRWNVGHADPTYFPFFPWVSTRGTSAALFTAAANLVRPGSWYGRLSWYPPRPLSPSKPKPGNLSGGGLDVQCGPTVVCDIAVVTPEMSTSLGKWWRDSHRSLFAQGSRSQKRHNTHSKSWL